MPNRRPVRTIEPAAGISGGTYSGTQVLTVASFDRVAGEIVLNLWKLDLTTGDPVLVAPDEVKNGTFQLPKIWVVDSGATPWRALEMTITDGKVITVDLDTWAAGDFKLYIGGEQAPLTSWHGLTVGGQILEVDDTP